MAEAQDVIIKSPVLSATKTAFGTTLAAVGTAGLAVFKEIHGMNLTEPVQIALLALGATAVLATALVIVGDYFARAYVTAAQLRVDSARTGSAPPPSGAEHAPATATLSTPGTPFTVVVDREGPAPFLVVAVRLDERKGETTYLVTRSGERPMWVPESRIVGSSLLSVAA